MRNIPSSPSISNIVVAAPEPSLVAARKLAKRFRLSASHAHLLVNLSGLGGRPSEARG